MRIIVYFDGTDVTWGGFDDAIFLDLPTDDPDEVPGMLDEILTTRGTVPTDVEHVIFEAPGD
jgi:hypothetical protein